MMGVGCNNIQIGDKKIIESDVLKILAMVEDFHEKATIELTKYFIENPGQISIDKIQKLKASNDAFVIAYKATKRAIADIKYAKAGKEITLSDISTELIIFAGEYAKIKKEIKIILGTRIIYPDEVLNQTPEASIKEIVQNEPASSVKSSCYLTSLKRDVRFQ